MNPTPRATVRRLALSLVLLAAGAMRAEPAAADEERPRREREVIVLRDGGGAIAAHPRRWAFEFPLLGGGFLGVELVPLSPELRVHFGAPADAGVMVGKVLDDGPAFRAGVRVGDIITAVDGEPVDSPTSLAGAVRAAADGATLALEIWRDGRMETLAATVERREPLPPARSLLLRCDDEAEDCVARLDRELEVDCGEADCTVTVECHEGDCECEVNGEPRDCGDIAGLDVNGD